MRPEAQSWSNAAWIPGEEQGRMQLACGTGGFCLQQTSLPVPLPLTL